MTFSLWAAVGAGLISVLAVLGALRKSKHPFRQALYSAGSGIAALGAVNLLSLYTGVSVAVNFLTSFAAVVLGVPGVVCLLLLKLLLA